MAPHNDVEAFHDALRSSRRVIALCGAGLSASSGLPTFRSAGGLWRSFPAKQLATMRAFRTDPGLVWLFYGYKRHCCLRADPNDGHRALAALSRSMDSDFLCLTQNDDNLSQRASHPSEHLLPLHGSLFDIKCSNSACDWVERNNFDDPFCSALEPASVDMPDGEPNPILDPYHRIQHVTEEELPMCPKCKTGLQRPGVLWNGEDLDPGIMGRADEFLDEGPLDMIFVIGTSAKFHPAAAYIEKARRRGGRVVVIDPKAEDEEELNRIKPGDFAFARDAAKALPVLLAPVIGDLQEDGTFDED